MLKVKIAVTLVAAGCWAFAQDFNRWTFQGGVGPQFPLGGAHDRFNNGWDLMFGAGRNITKNFAALLEYHYDRSSLSGLELANANQPDGFNRFWSFTINPRYEFPIHGRWGAYGTGGYGIYSRRLAFTDPSLAQGYCDPYYGCYGTGAPIVAENTIHNGGVNFGGGVTWALGESGLKVFTDVRYHRFLSHQNIDFLEVSFGLKY